MPGMPPKPTAIRLLEGNAGGVKINHFEPKPGLVDGLPAPPSEVVADPDALDTWYELGPKLIDLGVLTELDIGGFVALCLTKSQYVRLSRRAEMLLSDPTLAMIEARSLSSAFRLTHEAFARYRGMMQDFGLTPASRSRVVTQKLSSRPKSTFGRIAAGRASPTAA